MALCAAMSYSTPLDKRNGNQHTTTNFSATKTISTAKQDDSRITRHVISSKISRAQSACEQNAQSTGQSDKNLGDGTTAVAECDKYHAGREHTPERTNARMHTHTRGAVFK